MRKLLVGLVAALALAACGTGGTTTANPSLAPSAAATSAVASSAPSVAASASPEASLPTAAVALLRSIGYTVNGPYYEKDAVTGVQHATYTWTNLFPHMPTLYIKDGRLARVQGPGVACERLPQEITQRPDLAIQIFQGISGDTKVLAGLDAGGLWTTVTVKAGDRSYTIMCQRFAGK
jgi:hypothetical protein